MGEKECIENGEAILGIELGSTRIKAVLIDREHNPIAAGSHDWENRLENGYWTYSLEEIHEGLRASYTALREDVKRRYGVGIRSLSAIGISAMMHGYMAFSKDGKLLVPFRTWRNGRTEEAARELRELFSYNIPERWSIAHLYQAMLNQEPHLEALSYVTTLSGYLHWRLTGKKVLGVGDASGMFPIDAETGDYNSAMVRSFETLAEKKGYPVKLSELFPKVLSAGEESGRLTKEGAGFLDESGELCAEILLCPPEGDAGTGMAATNSVAVRTGNVSAGTSAFVMIVLERALKAVHPEIDLVSTPDGKPVAMVHANNCTSDLNAWVQLFHEVLENAGIRMEMGELYGMLYRKALTGDADCGGILSYGFLSGEYIAKVSEGRPMVLRLPDAPLRLSNFMRAHLFSALGALRMGMHILTEEEDVRVREIYGHGGFFKTPEVGQRFMAAAMETSVSVMETAGEGGAWGIALLAAYLIRREAGESLEDYLGKKVFGRSASLRIEPEAEDAAGFTRYMERFTAGLSAERTAAACVQ